jgi:hypothetical protein
MRMGLAERLPGDRRGTWRNRSGSKSAVRLHQCASGVHANQVLGYVHRFGQLEGNRGGQESPTTL